LDLTVGPGGFDDDKFGGFDDTFVVKLTKTFRKI
jgi:hypothetical protein